MHSRQSPQPLASDGSAQVLTGAPKKMKRSSGEVPGPGTSPEEPPPAPFDDSGD
ncbi:hypothetical protein [Sorangium sp. So ce1024]|uniref:hypothetical protein n=1 Tax=unclassified Sorangium TaxID=2621164 RepID=UPI003F0333C8